MHLNTTKMITPTPSTASASKDVDTETMARTQGDGRPVARQKLDNVMSKWEVKAKAEPRSYVASALHRAQRTAQDAIDMAEDFGGEDGDRFVLSVAEYLGKLYIEHHKPNELREMLACGASQK